MITSLMMPLIGESLDFRFYSLEQFHKCPYFLLLLRYFSETRTNLKSHNGV